MGRSSTTIHRNALRPLAALLAVTLVAALPACGLRTTQPGGAGGRDAGGAALPGDFVDIADVEPSVAVEIRYATTNNFTGVAVYPVGRCLLRKDVAERLARVQRALAERGLGLKVWDCYRPISVQQRFWKLVPDARYVARPEVVEGKAVKGSKHNRGAAVDVTLVDASGTELRMPSDYDDFSERAHRDHLGAPSEAVRNMRLLEVAMVRAGFEPLPTEWWHFDAPGWERYELSDAPLEP